MASSQHFSTFTRSTEIFSEAQRLIPGGVNSPVRAFRAVGGDPVVIARGKGSRVWDVDGNEYIDYVGSWGPLVLGHAPDEVVDAVCSTGALGTSFGALTEREVEFAKLLCDAVPGIEKVRLVSSGTEAVMSAIRLARAATGRDLVIKFEGGYHGHSDGLLAKAGSGVATQGIPGSPGVPKAFAELTVTIPFNDIQALRRVLDARGGEVACLIGEPVPANMGVILPRSGYWAEAREMLTRAGTLLISDEVITGFRLGWTGGADWVGVKPDLYTMGKIIGGGLPVGAYGGRADLMSMIAPEGPVYQAGTLSGNPLAVAGGLAALRTLKKTSPYPVLERNGKMLADGLAEAASDAGVPVTINRAGSMMTVFFNKGPVTDYAEAAKSDTKQYAVFFQACLKSGVMLAPSQFEATFVSTAHTEDDIKATISRASEAFKGIRTTTPTFLSSHA
ncbi:MAG: glutamate-1-semialdehyde 2,1-aminomutase [Chloroflexi bacterium]|nr:glutamate-1-semialdehyde 2,1-aminomutase [Chloroflexota bacterium]